MDAFDAVCCGRLWLWEPGRHGMARGHAPESTRQFILMERLYVIIVDSVL